MCVCRCLTFSFAYLYRVIFYITLPFSSVFFLFLFFFDARVWKTDKYSSIGSFPGKRSHFSKGKRILSKRRVKKSESQTISSSVTGSLSKISVRRRRWRALPVILDSNWKSCFLRDKLVVFSFLLFTRILRNLNRYLRILEKNLYINYSINCDFRKG